MTSKTKSLKTLSLQTPLLKKWVTVRMSFAKQSKTQSGPQTDKSKSTCTHKTLILQYFIPTNIQQLIVKTERSSLKPVNQQDCGIFLTYANQCFPTPDHLPPKAWLCCLSPTFLISFCSDHGRNVKLRTVYFYLIAKMLRIACITFLLHHSMDATNFAGVLWF